MCEAWMHDTVDTAAVDEDRLNRLKHKIHGQIHGQVRLQRTANHALTKWLQLVAAILLPVFVVTTWFLYRENNQLTTQEMLVSTGVGERANVTLPDGTRVQLNAQSKLTYAPVAYNKKNRQIHFDGEGYFQVAKNKECPFLIDAQGLAVKVLGTKFNLLARRNDQTAELILQEGSVSFTSLMTNDQVILKPEQKVVLNQQEGSMTLYNLKHVQDVAAWMRHKMVFRNIPLADVITAIEKQYQVEVITDSKRYLKETFTGTLSTTDINDDLQILEKSFHFKIMMKNKKIFISSKR